jgi:hypothetical protein
MSEFEAILERLRRASRTGQSVHLYTLIGILDNLRADIGHRDGDDTATNSTMAPSPKLTEAPASTKTTLRVFYGLSLPDAAYKQLQIVNGPQTPTEIWAGLDAAGFTSAHSAPVNAVVNALKKRSKRHGDVLLVGKGKWDLKSRYTERELADIEKSRGGMAGRDPAAHREKTSAGMLAARSRGVHVGKPFKLTADIVSKFKELVASGMSVRDACKGAGFSYGTYHNYRSQIDAWSEGQSWPPPATDENPVDHAVH